MVKNVPAQVDVRDAGLIPGLGRSPGGGLGNSLWYLCLQNPMNRRTWRAIVHRVAKSQTQLKALTYIPHTHQTHTHSLLAVLGIVGLRAHSFFFFIHKFYSMQLTFCIFKVNLLKKISISYSS